MQQYGFDTREEEVMQYNEGILTRMGYTIRDWFWTYTNQSWFINSRIEQNRLKSDGDILNMSPSRSNM